MESARKRIRVGKVFKKETAVPEPRRSRIASDMMGAIKGVVKCSPNTWLFKGPTTANSTTKHIRAHSVNPYRFLRQECRPRNYFVWQKAPGCRGRRAPFDFRGSWSLVAVRPTEGLPLVGDATLLAPLPCSGGRRNWKRVERATPRAARKRPRGTS